MEPSRDEDRAFMLLALELASRPARRPWPNPPVGAVVVRNGVVVGRGAHHGAGTAHAEAVALAEAGERARGATLYCTLEPCNHHGRTPPCAPLVADSGVARLVVAIRDPNPRVAGGGLEHARRRGLAVTLGTCAGDALELAWPFVVTRGFSRPFVLLKTAVSLDGLFAPAGMRPGSGPAYLTSEESRRRVHSMRRWSDLVLIGSATAATDRPRLDGRLAGAGAACPSEDPLPAVVSSRLAAGTPWRGRPHVAFVGPDAGPAETEAAGAAGATVVRCSAGERAVDPSSVLAGLREMGKHTLLLEGGPSLAASFLEAGLVDRWIRFTAPLVFGEGVGWPSRAGASGGPRGGAFTLTRVGVSGPDSFSVWDRVPFAATCSALSREAAFAGREGA